MKGMVVYLTGAGSVLGDGLAAALHGGGATVGLLPGTATADATRAAFAALAGEIGGPSAVVLAAVDERAITPRPLAEVDDQLVEAVWETGMRSTIACFQSAFHAFGAGGKGGRIVLVVPTLGMSGAPERAPWCALLEGQRLLVKSAARQWGPHGISVNCLAVAAELVLPPGAHRSDEVSLAPPGVGRAGAG